MEQMKQNDIELLEENAKTTLYNLAQEDSTKKEAISAFMEELNIIFSECKEWMKTNMDPSVLEPRLKKLKVDTETLVMNAKEKIQTITDKPEVKEKLLDGKEKVFEVTTKVAHVVSEGTQEFLRQENVKKVVDNVSDKVTAIKSDERLKEGVASLKKGTLKVAESAFNGLKKILDDDTTEEHEQ